MGGEVTSSSGGEGSEKTGGAGGDHTDMGGDPICDGADCECSSDRIACDNKCIDPETNSTFCGASGDCSGSKAGETCAEQKKCVGGVCSLVCDSGFIACDDSCIDPLENRDYCGAVGECLEADRGEECADGEACLGGKCRKWGSASLLATRSDNHIFYSDLAVGPTGDAWVAFGRANSWYGRGYIELTGTWNSEDLLSSATRLGDAIGMTDKGEALALAGQYLSEAWRMTSSVGVNGNFPGLTEITPQSTSESPLDTSVAAGAKGDALAAWRLSGAPGIATARFLSESQTWDGVEVISSNAGTSWPQAAANSNRLLVAWGENSDELHAGLNPAGSWDIGIVPGSTSNGVKVKKALLNEAGEALVSYSTSVGDLETWGVGYSFAAEAWTEHFLIRTGDAKVISSAQGAFAYGQTDSTTTTEIWWRQSVEGMTDFGTAKTQVLLDEPAKQLLVVSNEVGQLFGVIATEVQIFWTVLDRETATWSQAKSFDRNVVGNLTLKEVEAGMDRFGRVIVIWREPDGSASNWDGVWTRRLE